MSDLTDRLKVYSVHYDVEKGRTHEETLALLEERVRKLKAERPEVKFIDERTRRFTISKAGQVVTRIEWEGATR